MGEGEVRAKASTKGSGAVELSTSNDTGGGNVVPGLEEHTAAAAVVFGAEACVLGRKRKLGGTVGGNAQAVRGSRGGAKSPAAAAGRLVTDIINHLKGLESHCDIG